MENYQTLTREKHLNHLVRVVPLLALAYGIQGYMMMSWAEEGPTGLLVLSLGFSLAISVMCMVGYDQRHQVSFNGEGFQVKAPWLFGKHHKTWDMVKEIEIIGTEDEFQTVTVKLHKKGSYTFYFVDNGYELKKQFELTHKSTETKLAA